MLKLKKSNSKEDFLIFKNMLVKKNELPYSLYEIEKKFLTF